MTRQIRLLGIGLMVCFAILFVQLNRLTVFQAAALNDNPNNTREILRDFSQPRGTVTTADGEIIARSVPSDDRFELQREFPFGPLFAHSQFEHVQDRVEIWLDPWQDPKGDGFQIVEAQFAFSAGGVTGTGINLGSPTRIPYAETDFIFAAVGEELGLLGAGAVLLAYLLMIGAGLRIALRTEVPFERLLATGLTVLLGVQSFIIIAGVIRVLPLTGVTLPFMSYGGSSLIANYVLLALLLRISDDTIDRERERAEVAAR